MSSYQRKLNMIEGLTEFQPDTSGTQGVLSREQQETVLDMVKWTSITRSDFTELDEKPGRYGDYSRWHWKLRQVRNRRTQDLFDILIQNEESLEKEEANVSGEWC